MANRMILNETSYFGAGSISAIVDEAKARAFKKILVVTDPSLVKFGVSTKVTKLLDEANIPYDMYTDIKANPTIANIQGGVAKFKEAGADAIVAIGGGSSMDTPNTRTLSLLKAQSPPRTNAFRSSPFPRPPVPLPRSPSTMLLPIPRRNVNLSALTRTTSPLSPLSMPI